MCSYKRIDHFKKLLSLIQYNNDDDINRIAQQVADVIDKSNPVTLKSVNDAFRKLRMHKYMEYAVHVYHRLKGLPPLVITKEQEVQLIDMFNKVQKKSETHFFPHMYLLFKFSEMVGLLKYFDFYPSSTSHVQLAHHDDLFYAICDHNNR